MDIQVKCDVKTQRVQKLVLKAENFAEERVLTALTDGIDSNAVVHVISDEVDVEFAFNGTKHIKGK